MPEHMQRLSGGSITLTEDVEAGTKDADVIYTDVWVSMGEPDEVWEERIRELTPYQVTKAVMENAGEKAIFLHCLPAFHDLKTKIGKEMGERFGLTDMEVTDEVFESEQSNVFDEAENRMHTIKAVMASYSWRTGEQYDRYCIFIKKQFQRKYTQNGRAKPSILRKETDSTNEWCKRLSKRRSRTWNPGSH